MSAPMLRIDPTPCPVCSRIDCQRYRLAQRGEIQQAATQECVKAKPKARAFFDVATVKLHEDIETCARALHAAEQRQRRRDQ